MRIRSLEMPFCSYNWPGQSGFMDLRRGPNLDDVQGLVDAGLGVEGDAGVDLSRNPAGDDLKDLTAELNEQVFESGIRLLVDSLAILLARGDGRFDQAGVFRHLGSGQNQGRVGSGIMGLILGEGFLG